MREFKSFLIFIIYHALFTDKSWVMHNAVAEVLMNMEWCQKMPSEDKTVGRHYTDLGAIVLITASQLNFSKKRIMH